MAEYKPDQFIVINKKHIHELCVEIDKHHPAKFASYSNLLIAAVDDFKRAYKEFVKKPLDQKYYVCNQDEPYADEVLQTILDHEDEKAI